MIHMKYQVLVLFSLKNNYKNLIVDSVKNKTITGMTQKFDWVVLQFCLAL